MKTLIYRLFLCISLAGLLLACKPAQTGQAPIQEKVTLTFIVPNEYQNLYEDAIERFKAQEPNITIQTRSQGFSADAGDVTLVTWFDRLQSDELQRIKPLDLTPLLQQERNFNPDDFLPGALETFKSEGKLTALPTGADPYVIFYNQDLFDRLGVSYPKEGWTWDDFRTTALQLTNAPAGIFGYLPSRFYFDSLFFVYGNGGSLFDDQSQPRVDSPETIQAIEWYASLFGANGGAPNQKQVQDAYDLGGGDVGIVTGKIGMWFGSLSSISTQLGGMIKFRLGIAPLPRGVQPFNLAQYEGLMIKADTANPQAAWRWVSFLAAQTNTWVYPARKSIAESPAFLNAFGKEKAAAVRGSLEGATRMSGLNFGRFRGPLMTYFMAVRDVVDQGVPAAEALHSAQKSIPQQ